MKLSLTLLTALLLAGGFLPTAGSLAAASEVAALHPRQRDFSTWRFGLLLHFNAAPVETTANTAGCWRVTLPVAASGSATIVLTATSKSSKTFTKVHLWPIGFVDVLGFDRDSLRTSDRTIAVFRPGQTATVRMLVKPRSGRLYPARGTYRIGLAVINDDGAYSIAAGDLEVTDVVRRN